MQVAKSFGPNAGKLVDEGPAQGLVDISQLSEMNVLPVQKQNKRCYDAQAILELVVRPRIVKRLGPREAVKEAWLFSKSMFKPYRYDTVDLLERCFEFDYG